MPHPGTVVTVEVSNEGVDSTYVVLRRNFFSLSSFAVPSKGHDSNAVTVLQVYFGM